MATLLATRPLTAGSRGFRNPRSSYILTGTRNANQFPRPWGSAENVLLGIDAEGLPSLLRLTMPGRM